ncbi:MAG: metallophosphoesterase family protein [Candidatus Omnitrophica bacterium]|nr:metallophosphoesterase family protein [Candidatus Omnitrophota bacterium]
MTRLLVLSDTHIPRASADMPKEIYKEIKRVDMILHAGDFVEKEFLDKLKALKEVRAVYGNMDSVKLRSVLSPKETIEIGKFNIGLIHGYGAPSDIINTVSREFSKVDAIVFGHSHSPVNTVKDGVLFFNPGSPTDKVFASYNSYGILEITDKKITGKVIRL